MSDSNESLTKEIVHPSKQGFVERVTPKEPGEGIFFFHCPNCEGIHFRHAGYAELMFPFIRPGDEKRIGLESHAVKVCVKCRSAYVWINEQMYDVTNLIDLEAWAKLEKEMHDATGPGGQC
jgi:hypothetical protein